MLSSNKGPLGPYGRSSHLRCRSLEAPVTARVMPPRLGNIIQLGRRMRQPPGSRGEHVPKVPCAQGEVRTLTPGVATGDGAWSCSVSWWWVPGPERMAATFPIL